MGKKKNQNRRQFEQIDEEGGLNRNNSKPKGSNIPLFILAFSAIGIICYLSKGGDNTNPSHKTEIDPNGTSIVDKYNNKYTLTRTFKRYYECYTQGFYFSKQGEWIESCGQYRQSKVQKLTMDETKKEFKRIKDTVTNNDDSVFGEGIDMLETKSGETAIYQLTWRERIVIKFDNNMKLLKKLDLPSDIREGWGITHDPSNPSVAFISDGSSKIYQTNVNEDGLKVTRIIKVVDGNGDPVDMLNELEFIKGYIWANVYLQTKVVKIDPKTGVIDRVFDFEFLDNDAKKVDTHLGYGDCLNGIAYDSAKNLWYFTGKSWRRIYEVSFKDE